MNKTYKIFIAICAVTLIAVIIWIVKTPVQKNKETVLQDEPVKISFSWWGNDERHAYTMEGVDVFQSLNSDVEVECRYGEWNGYEKRINVRMKSHTEADVMQINYAWLEEYSPDGEGYYDLYQLADYIDLDNFSEEDLKYGEVNGKLNAIPIAFNTSTLFYNQDIFDAYGLELPTTWDDYFDAAKVLSKDGIYALGMSKKQLVLFLIAYYEQTTGKNFFSQEGELLATQEDMIYVLEFYKKLIDEKVLLPVDQFSREKFTDGEVAGTMIWISDAGKYCSELESTGATVALGEYPMADGAELSGWYRKPATMYAISNITEYPEEAARLLNFLLNSDEMAELQKTEKGIPVSKSAVAKLESEDALGEYEYSANLKMLEESDIMNVMIPVMEQDEVLDAFKQEADEYIYDKTDVSTCAENICNSINEVIASDD